MRIASQIARLGFFWLPSTPDKRTPGIVKVSDGRHIELEIIGNLDADLAQAFESIEIPRILEIVDEEGAVTLHDCILSPDINEDIVFRIFHETLVEFSWGRCPVS